MNKNTINGSAVTNEQIAEWAQQADDGYDPEALTSRVRLRNEFGDNRTSDSAGDAPPHS